MPQVAKKETELDYKALGLKCGLEIHQQLDTGRKLFCRCEAKLRLDAPQTTIIRHMRPTLSELGEYDVAALMEFKKQKEIIYEIHDSTCTYELDETPPFEPDPNAIDLAITIARLFQMEIIDELHVNRKQYLDGSIPTGFQRTMIVGVGGKVKAAGKTINLDFLALEEDSCREVSDVAHEITWRVDRIGTPEVEIATKTLTISDPEQIRVIAEAVGRILRATGKVKRGLGTIRQDLNISIAKGVRVEMKGIQMLDMLPLYIKYEVIRQVALLEIKEELKKRELSPEMFKENYLDCNEVFKGTSCKFLVKALKKKELILGIKLPKMKGLLGRKIQGDRSFGKEIADRVMVITGLGGLIHTDELPDYGITKGEVERLRALFECEEEDAVAFVTGNKVDAEKAITEIIIRIREAFDGVPLETRHSNEDGTSRFERYLGGAGRMYPDTDSEPIVITESRIKRIDENLPELPDEREERYLNEYKLSPEIAKELAISQRALLFDELMKMGVEPITAAVALEQTLKALMREEIPIEKLSDKRIKEIFELLLEKKIAKEAIESLFKHFSQSPSDKIENALKTLGLESLSEEQLLEIIAATINENIDYIKQHGKRAFSKLMGLVMEKVRGKVDGKIVNEALKRRFGEKLEELGIAGS